VALTSLASLPPQSKKDGTEDGSESKTTTPSVTPKSTPTVTRKKSEAGGGGVVKMASLSQPQPSPTVSRKKSGTLSNHDITMI
jgi:hypothetical protein